VWPVGQCSGVVDAARPRLNVVWPVGQCSGVVDAARLRLNVVWPVGQCIRFVDAVRCVYAVTTAGARNQGDVSTLV
jgi:hypothetical protein